MSVSRPARTCLSVVAAILERNGSILVCQRSRRDSHALKWEFPGGKVEPGESPRAALERELEEELAIQARIGPEIARSTHQYEGRPPLRLIFYRVSEFQGDPENRVFEQIRWVPPARLPEYDFVEADADLVRKLAGGP